MLEFDFSLRLHVRKQPFLKRRHCETKTSASGINFTKSSGNCFEDGWSCARIDNITCVRRVRLSIHAAGTPVFVHQLDSSNTRLTHRFEFKFATCIANIQWCVRHCSDQAFNPCCCASATAVPSEYPAKARSIPRNWAARRSYVAF